MHFNKKHLLVILLCALPVALLALLGGWRASLVHSKQEMLVSVPQSDEAPRGSRLRRVLVQVGSMEALKANMSRWDEFRPCSSMPLLFGPVDFVFKVEDQRTATQALSFLRTFPFDACYGNVYLSWSRDSPSLEDGYSLILPATCVPVKDGWLELLQMKAIEAPNEAFKLKATFGRGCHPMDTQSLRGYPYNSMSECRIVGDAGTGIPYQKDEEKRLVERAHYVGYTGANAHLTRFTGLIYEDCEGGITTEQAVALMPGALLVNLR